MCQQRVLGWNYKAENNTASVIFFTPEVAIEYEA